MKRVIVEMQGRAGLARTAPADMSVAQLGVFKIDPGFPPVPVPASVDAAARVAAANEEVVIVRGEIDEADEAALRSQPGVLGVWTDGRIEAFGDCGCGGGGNGTPAITASPGYVDVLSAQSADGGVAMHAFDLTLATPCPPTDCASTVAKGTLLDVAKYLKADRLWAKGIKGQGVVIGICDTGVDKTKVPNVIGGWTPNPTYPPGTDPGGHGSMCATDALGVSPEARIYDIGILKSTGGISGLLSDAIAAYQWALTQYNTDRTPQILSNSWGMFQQAWAPDYAVDPNHPFTRKVVEVINAGIIVTFAAGNCGQECPSGRCASDTGPGRSIWGANGHPQVITVGAANILEQWIGYTSQGPAALDPNKPDFCAPSHFKGFTSCDNGTSAANPVCAGVLGLLKSHDPSLNQARAKDALQKTAKNLCSAGWDPHSGHGMIQAEAAFNFLYHQSLPLASAMWIHGSSVEEEFPDRLNYVRRAGFYSEFDGKPGSYNWFHFALPTPVIQDNVRLKLDSIMLMFLTDPDVVVDAVHIYDGAWKIKSFDGMSLSGSHLFERFDILNNPVRFGIGISIGVRFGTAAGSHFVRFISAGGDYIK